MKDDPYYSFPFWEVRMTDLRRRMSMNSAFVACNAIDYELWYHLSDNADFEAVEDALEGIGDEA